MVGYVYHFKTSNGTHHFKTYDVAAMINELNTFYLNDIKQKEANEVEKERVVTKVVEKIVEKVQYVNNTCVINFAQNSYKLTDSAKETLDNIKGSVDILGYASPEGNESYNLKLSQKRADVVAEYLKNKGVEVKSAVGYGSVSNESNRIVIVKDASGK